MFVPVFFSQKVDAALKGKGEFAQLDILAEMILDAEDQKQRGYGPSQDEINRARRRWLDIYESTYAERIPA